MLKKTFFTLLLHSSFGPISMEWFGFDWLLVGNVPLLPRVLALLDSYG
jgi:hypothetical protein